MSVSAGVGGTSVVGAVVGGTAAPATAASTLPFTGASHLMDLVALAIVLLVAGVLAVGLARRSSGETSP
ncbi:MAG: hypothetical protein ACTHK4_07350 [Mycobacteriales bacterium]